MTDKGTEMMKHWITRLTALLLLAALMTATALAANASGYSDVPDGHWAAQSVRRCTQLGLLQGVGGGKFGRGQEMTRAAYAAALCRLMGWQMLSPAKGSFDDNQNTAKWYYSAVETAAAHDAFPGHSRFCRPTDAITREEMAAMTVRALGYGVLAGIIADADAQPVQSDTLGFAGLTAHIGKNCPFADCTTNRGYIALAYRMGIMTGVNSKSFDPKATATREQAAAIDMNLLKNPALLALGVDHAPEPGHSSMQSLFDTARKASKETGKPADSEWVYRQTMSLLVRSLRLPYRFDAALRSDLARGSVAVGFTTAGVSMMPATRYDEQSGQWVTLRDRERAALSADYNLRVGLMLALLSFGACDNVQEVSLHVDSLGLEEAVAEQDTAIEAMMSEALSAFERMHTGDMGPTGSKAEPKDGDMHGDPSRTAARSIAEMGSDSFMPPVGAPHDESDADAGDASMEQRFEDLVKGIDIDETTFADPGEQPAGFKSDDDGNQDDPMNVLRRNPTVRTLATVRFTRNEFLERIRQDGLEHPQDTYRMFNATIDVDENGGLKQIVPDFDLRDRGFAPAGSQEEPEMADHEFTPEAAQALGARNAFGLSIQRVDVMQRADSEFHRLSSDTAMPSVAKAQEATRIIDTIADPELSEQSAAIAGALIDGRDTPTVKLDLATQLDNERARMHDMLFSGQPDQACESAENLLKRMDALYAQGDGVPRYFNSYAERVVYNRLFATPDEHTVLIPDNLFYMHMEMADMYAQLKGTKEALPHLNAMVAYAPSYPLAHLKLAVQLARDEDWDSARAACLNALLVALDRDDAAFAYYRLAYAEWMQDTS